MAEKESSPSTVVGFFKKLTTFVWGAVSVLITFAFIGGVILFAWNYFDHKERQQQRQLVVNTEAQKGVKARMAFGEVRPVAGSPFAIITLSDENDEESGLASYSRQVFRNLLWVNQESGVARWLFPGMEQRIETLEIISESVASAHNKSIEEIPKLVRLTLIPGDTNGDGRLTTGDTHAMALVRPDGTGYRLVLKEVQRIHLVRLQEKHLLVIYQLAGNLRIARFGLDDFVPRQDVAVPDMGAAHALVLGATYEEKQP